MLKAPSSFHLNLEIANQEFNDHRRLIFFCHNNVFVDVNFLLLELFHSLLDDFYTLQYTHNRTIFAFFPSDIDIAFVILSNF